ncbi:MAG TPA: hypothetical protein VI197_12125 [Polyangiaceae bacterium]
MCSSKVQGRSIIGFCSLLLLSGCGGIAESDEFIEVQEEEQVGISWEEYRDQAEISSNGKVAYVVEGDLFFDSEADLYAYYEETILNDGWKLAVFQRLSNGSEPVYTRTEALDIKYCVSNLFQSSYAPFDKNRVVTEAQAAMRDWEKVANVRFRYVSAQDSTCTETNANVDFAIIPMTTTSFAGCATNKKMWSGPNMGCPNTAGTTVYTGMLGMNYNLIGGVLSATGLFRHELGHMLGFRHEHPWKPGSLCTIEAPTMPGDDLTGRRLTDYDVQSVMHYTGGSCTPTETEWVISQLDGVGARSIYGMPTSWVMTVLD